MTRVRVFYGHEGIVPPTGLLPRSAAEPAPEADVEVDSYETIPGTEGGEPFIVEGETLDEVEAATADAEVEAAPADAEVEAATADAEVEAATADAEVEAAPTETPDDSWTKADLLDFAESAGIDMTGATKTKGAALARVLENLEEE